MTHTLPIVKPIAPDVKKASTPQKTGIPTNMEEAPSSMTFMTPNKSVVQKVNVSKNEVKKVYLQNLNRLPIEKEDDVISKLPTLIPAPVTTSLTIPANVPVLMDADQDGISDDKDPCPYIKGSAATGGCPDTDGDGVIDMNDQCPLEAGEVRLKGCPARNVLTDGGSIMTQHFGNIEFKTSSAVVHVSYKLYII